jgi:hypothetical protein
MATSSTFTTGLPAAEAPAASEFCVDSDPRTLDKLLSAIPNLYQPRTNRNIKALTEALAEGDCLVLQEIPEFKDQLFVETADTKYLDRLGANVGVPRPDGVGMTDADYRVLIPTMSFVPKQIRTPIYKLLKIWYEDEATFTNMTSANAEPYNFTGLVGDLLQFTVEGAKTVSIEIRAIDYANIAAVTADELSLAINKLSDEEVIAKSRIDSITKLKHVNVRTTTQGPTGTIQVVTGGVQTLLSFPTDKQIFNDILRPAVLYEVNNREVVVILPSSPPIVTRGLEGSAHFHPDETTGNWEGPYLFDPRAKFSISSVNTTTSVAINPGQVLTNIQTTTIPSTFPTSGGSFILDFGISTQEGPIDYILIPNSNNIIIDPTHVFQKAHASGADLRFVRSVSPPDLEADGSDFAAYVTGLAAARNALRDLIRDVVAAGMVIRFIVLTPEYRFSNPALNTNEAV